MAKEKGPGILYLPALERSGGCPGDRTSGVATAIRVNEKILAAIEEGRPVARSTLRKALLAVRQATGSMFDLDAYIVDQRTPTRDELSGSDEARPAARRPDGLKRQSGRLHHQRQCAHHFQTGSGTPSSTDTQANWRPHPALPGPDGRCDVDPCPGQGRTKSGR